MRVPISRRALLTGTSAAFVTATLIKAQQHVEDGKTLIEASDRNLRAYNSQNSSFRSEMEHSFPGLYQDPTFQTLLPLSLIVTLDRGPEVRALSVVWTVTADDSKFEVPMFSYVMPGSAAKRHSLTTLRSGQRALLTQGNTRLITPFFNWTSIYYQGLGKPQWREILQQREPAALLLDKNAEGKKISTSLDAVVFADWKVGGPDKHKLSRRLQSRMNAEHDEGARLYRLLKSGASDHDLNAVLAKTCQRPRPSVESLPTRWYQEARIYHAQVLMRHLAEADRGKVLQALLRLKKQPKVVTSRLEQV